MKSIARKNDKGTGCIPYRYIKTSSPNCFVNNKAISRLKDKLKGCNCPNSPKIISASSNTKVNGKRITRLYDKINCNGKIVSGSPNVKV